MDVIELHDPGVWKVTCPEEFLDNNMPAIYRGISESGESPALTCVAHFLLLHGRPVCFVQSKQPLHGGVIYWIAEIQAMVSSEQANQNIMGFTEHLLTRRVRITAVGCADVLP